MTVSVREKLHKLIGSDNIFYLNSNHFTVRINCHSSASVFSTASQPLLSFTAPTFKSPSHQKGNVLVDTNEHIAFGSRAKRDLGSKEECLGERSIRNRPPHLRVVAIFLEIAVLREAYFFNVKFLTTNYSYKCNCKRWKASTTLTLCPASDVQWTN